MNPPRGGDVSNPKRKGDFLRETVQECIKGFEGPVVDDHAQTAELRISAFVEANPLRKNGVFDAWVAGGAEGVATP